jgi:hypothetical protein
MHINIHPNPEVSDFDLHLPYVAGPFRNQNKEVRHGPEVWAQNLLSVIGNDNTVVLCNNGEPYSRLDMTRLALAKYAPDVEVTMQRSVNHNQYQKSDPLFSNRSAYKVLPNLLDRQPIREALQFYLENFQNFEKNSIRAYDRDQGFFPYNNMVWYNFGKLMPTTNNQHNIDMNKLLGNIWHQISEICKNTFKQFNIPDCDIENGLNIRIVHNEPGHVVDDGYQFFKHIDGSLITGWLYEMPRGANIGVWTTDAQKEQHTEMIPVQDLYDQDSRDLLIIPGTAWCDHGDNDTAATWHEVRVPENFNDHRVSMVFLLRAPSFEKTTYQFDQTSV